MKPNQQAKAKPNNINVNHINQSFYSEDHCRLYYFEKLNVFIFDYDLQGVEVGALEKRKDNQLHFKENRLTRQIQSQLEQLYTSRFLITFDEESEEIIIIEEDNQNLKICTFTLQQNEFQIGMRDYNFKHMHFDQIQAFQKYYIGKYQNQVYIFRKNNMKIVLRQILKYPYLETQTQSFHLLLIRRGKDVLFYKISSFKMKIIRKLKLQDFNQGLHYQGKYIAIQENLQLRIIDSTNMKQKQYSNLQKMEVLYGTFINQGYF